MRHSLHVGGRGSGTSAGSGAELDELPLEIVEMLTRLGLELKRPLHDGDGAVVAPSGKEQLSVGIEVDDIIRLDLDGLQGQARGALELDALLGVYCLPC